MCSKEVGDGIIIIMVYLKNWVGSNKLLKGPAYNKTAKIVQVLKIH